jgi:EAL and modified HD-GYP domain-containing signal transduction protein
MKWFRSLRQRGRTRRLGDIHEEWVEAHWAPAASDAGNHRFVALQPIFDRRRKVFGYEALSRSKWENRFTGDPDTATRTMIDDWLLHGLDELTRGSRTFINCSFEALAGGAFTLLPTRIVLELLENVEPSPEVVSACRKMKTRGYQISLDDFQLSRKMEILLALADYVKVDFRLTDSDKRRAIVRRVKGLATIPVAEKIETEEEFETAVAEGFRLFQGYSLGAPVLFSKRRFPSLDANHLRETRMPVFGGGSNRSVFDYS